MPLYPPQHQQFSLINFTAPQQLRGKDLGREDNMLTSYSVSFWSKVPVLFVLQSFFLHVSEQKTFRIMSYYPLGWRQAFLVIH